MGKLIDGRIDSRMSSAGQYGPRDRLLLCRGASCTAQVTHTRCWTLLGEMQLLVACSPDAF